MDDDDHGPHCIGYGIPGHPAPRITDDESLCPDCFAALIGDLTSGRPLRGAWRPGPMGETLRPPEVSR